MESAFQEPSLDAVRTLLRSMAGQRVLVVGDLMLDVYIYGHSLRISSEAPVQIVNSDREESLLGGAGNVAKCLIALGAQVQLCGIIGKDAAGDQFLTEAQSLGMDTTLILQESSRPTLVKTRIVAGRQHILRVDRESKTPWPESVLQALTVRVHDAVKNCDAVLLCDYDKGVLAPMVCSTAIQGAGVRPIVVDPKGHNWKKYMGATLLKPNWSEAQGMLATRDSSILSYTVAVSSSDVETVAHRLRRGIGVKNVILTRGDQGMSIASPNNVSGSFPALARQVLDEAGAGDIVGAVSCLAMAAGAECIMAAWLGNVAASIKVAKFGASTVSDYEILEALGEKIPASKRKVLTIRQAVDQAERWRAENKTVVFTNGCFDILHLGHVSYLEKSRALGDALIVGINTDASVRRLKGPERPVTSEQDRARIIASQECVDAVVIFDEDTPLELIRSIKPNVLCKGADYKRRQDIVGWDVVESYGGRVERIDLVEGLSTSKVIEKMRSNGDAVSSVAASAETDPSSKNETQKIRRRSERNEER